jgi:nucleoside-triphosphatase THEP1
MEEAWEDLDLAKLSINQMIGLWATDGDQIYHVKTSNDPCDGIGAWAKRFVTFDGGQIYDFIYATQVLSNFSMRPIHDHIMATEHVRIAQLLFALQALKVPPRCIKCIKTDCVVVKGFPKKRKADMMELAKLTFKDLPRLRARYCESDSQGYLDSYCSIKEVDHDAEVFRLGEGKELQGNWKPPWRFSEQPTPRAEWKELTKEEALSTILEGKGLLIVGSPGVGKTFWLRNAIASLRQAGKRIEIVSKTHASVQNIGCEAVTCDHWVRKHVRAGGVHCHTLVVEELTQINVQLWADLALCAFKGVSFVCSGDFGQFQPICEHWCGSPVPEGKLEQSDMLHEMCGGNVLVLTENMRSDAKLFGFYTSLGSNLEEALARARMMFPVTDRPAAYTLTMSHRNRIKINKLRNQQEALTGFRWDDAAHAWENTVFIKMTKTTALERRNKAGNQPQDFILWPGLQLIGAGHRCLKGMFYEVATVDETFVELTNGLKLTHEQALKSLMQ